VPSSPATIWRWPVEDPPRHTATAWHASGRPPPFTMHVSKVLTSSEVLRLLESPTGRSPRRRSVSFGDQRSNEVTFRGPGELARGLSEALKRWVEADAARAEAEVERLRAVPRQDLPGEVVDPGLTEVARVGGAEAGRELGEGRTAPMSEVWDEIDEAGQ